MSRRSTRWVPMPLELAAPWFTLPALTRALGAELFRSYQDARIDVALDAIEDVVVRMLGPDPRERKALRHAVRSIVDAGLLVPLEGGGCRLLYGRDTYTDHMRKVDGRSTEGAPKVDGRSTDGVQKVDGRSTDGVQTVQAKSAESLEVDSYKRERREREEREKTPLPPVGPASQPVGWGSGDGLSPASGGHTFEVTEGWREAYSAAQAGVTPVLGTAQLAQAVEFARRVAREHDKPLRVAARDIAAAAIAQCARPADRAFEFSRLDPYVQQPQQQRTGSDGLPETIPELRALGLKACATGNHELAKKVNAKVARIEERDERGRRARA